MSGTTSDSHNTNMNATDYDAVTYDGAVYCSHHLPEGVDINSDEVSPIFADDEVDSYPVCNQCGEKHDYMTLLPDGIISEAENANQAKIFHVSASKFANAQSSDTWMEESMDLNNVDWDNTESVELESKVLEGWYWWTCLPGCMPDSDAYGPFKTELGAAIDNLDS